MSDLYNVMFRGDILPGHNLPEVKTRVAALFKLDDAKLAAVFSGKPVVLKKDCDLATAEKIKAALAKVGADSEIKSTAALAQAAAPAAKPVPPAAAKPLVPPPATPRPAPAAPAPASAAAMANDAAGLKVAPVGMVMTEAERAAQRKPPVQVKIDHISLEKRASSFMAADEKPAAQKRPEIQAPDFGIAAAGGDLLKPEEKRVFEELDLDLSNIHLAEVGADMLPEDQKIHVEPVKVADLNVGLAPVGSDMGEMKKGPPPPPPKTDHLKLV